MIPDFRKRPFLSQVVLIMWFEGNVLPINLVLKYECDTDTEDDDDCNDSGLDDGQGVYDFLQD